MRSRRRTIVVASGVLAVVVGAGIYWFGYLGTPLYDEWHCKRGEAPFVEDGEGGRACLRAGTELSEGRSWDPLGNRPFFCDGRRGWTVIHRGDEEDCLRDGIELPEGWTAGPAR